MLKARSTRRVIMPKLQSRPHSQHISSSTSRIGCMKQSLMIGFGVWFTISIIYYIIVILTSKNNTSSKTSIHPTLKSKYNTIEYMDMDNSTPQQNIHININKNNEYKYGHPSAEDMSNPCIVILTYNRPKQLLRTINSLLSIEGVTSYEIYISQDGRNPSTTNMIKNTINAISYKNTNKESNDRRIIKHIIHKQANYVRDPTSKLAIHYKFMFNIIFTELNHSHAIILEDDMIFSFDFLEYFASTVYLLNNNSNNLFCISSWNDYGQKFLNHNDKILYRTDYFPGLGWLLKKSLWIEIENIFPNDHWDHFMRMDIITKNRDCIFPDISRNYNIGQIGSTMDGDWYNKYLKPIQFNQKSKINFREINLSYLEKLNYEQYIIDIIKNKAKFVGIFPNDLNKIFKQLQHPNIDIYGNFLLIVYHGYYWKQIANKINVLETQRTRYKHNIIIKKNNVMYIFANIRFSAYLKYNKDTNKLINTIKNKDMNIITGNTGQSCDIVCRNNNMKCLNDHFEYVNFCSVLLKYFKCQAGCLGGQIGEDVPNYVSVQKPGLFQKCLTTEFAPKCGASHRTTSRICPCA